MRSPQTLALGVVFIVLGFAAWVLHLTSADSGTHAWDSAPSAPTTAFVRGGHLYHLSTIAGIVTADKQTGSDEALSCSYTGQAGTNVFLDTTKMSDDARILHRVATFVAPETGSISVACASIGPVFVDDATDSAFDRSGFFVILTVILGLVGVLLALFGISDGPARAPDGPDGEMLHVAGGAA